MTVHIDTGTPMLSKIESVVLAMRTKSLRRDITGRAKHFQRE
jgi:hypothetical protein